MRRVEAMVLIEGGGVRPATQHARHDGCDGGDDACHGDGRQISWLQRHAIGQELTDINLRPDIGSCEAEAPQIADAKGPGAPAPARPGRGQQRREDGEARGAHRCGG